MARQPAVKVSGMVNVRAVVAVGATACPKAIVR
jgi:hypothetical protein